jgi:hypothetical protein
LQSQYVYYYYYYYYYNFVRAARTIYIYIMANWLDSSNNANCFKNTYVQGFMDVSGGSIITRGTGGGLVIGGDSSLNGTVYLGDSIFVRSDGKVASGTADNGATAKPDISGNAENGAIVKPDITGGPTVEGSTVLSQSLPANPSWGQIGSNFTDIVGHAVSLSADGEYLAVSNHGTNSVYAYKRNGTSWSAAGSVGGTSGSNFGWSVSAVRASDSSLYVAVGAYGSGSVSLRRTTGTTLSGVGTSITLGSNFGSSVSLIQGSSGKLYLAAGGNTYSSGGLTNRGFAQIYEINGTQRSQIGADIYGKVNNAQMGHSISLIETESGLTVAIGAPDGNAVYVYQYVNSEWTQLGGDIVQTQIGRTVSLVDTTDGLTVAAGKESGSSRAVWVYRYNGSSWQQLGSTISDYRAVSLTNDATFGLILAVGSPTSAKVYRYVNSTWTLYGNTIDNIGYSVSLAVGSKSLMIAAGSNSSNLAGAYEIPYTITYSDVSGGYYDISGGYLNDGLTSAALYVNGDTDLSGGLTVSGDVSFNTGNLFVAGDLSLNGNLFINSFAANSIGADAIDSTVDINFANKLSVSTADLSFSATGLQVATDFNANSEPTDLATNLTVPANIAIVDGSNGTIYGSYLTLTNKDATAYYNVGKSVSGIFNIVDQASAGVYLASGGTSFTGTSDARLKTNIAPLESATDKIMALNPCTYQWKSEVESAADNTSTNTKPHVGFIAQEVEQLIPELVHPIDHPAGPDYKGVNTTDMIPYLVRTIQEQTQRITRLQEKLAAIKNQQ